MASQKQAKQYIAHWFQLGKKVLLHNGQEELLPQPVIEGDRYSPQFERCWQRILSDDSGDCYLEGTNQTIKQLLTSAWDIIPCVRCDMPIPVIDLGIQDSLCPCHDLPDWPNTELPAPRSPVDSSTHLTKIQYRLHKLKDC